MAKNSQVRYDYTARDYDGFMELFTSNIGNLTPEWTDKSETDMGMAILSLSAVGLDIMSYQIDKATRENILPLAKTKRSILLLTKFLGYSVQWQQASTGARQQFTKRAGKLGSEVVIPAGTKVSTNPELGGTIVFETDSTLIIPPGVASATVSVTQGESYTELDIGVSSGGVYQTFLIPYIDVLKESVIVETEERGTKFEWERVDDFLESTPNSRHFTLMPTEDSEVLVTFGDGKAGMIPEFGSPIYASIRVGGGTNGNLSIGLINNLVVDNTDIDSTSNLDATENGLDFEDLELVREKAPKKRRSGGVAVLATDYEDLAELVPGVRRAVAVEMFNEINEIRMYISTMDGVPYTTNLESIIKNELVANSVLNQTVTVMPVQYKDVTLVLTVYIYPDVDPDLVKFEVENQTRDFFNPNSFKFAETVYLGQVASENYRVQGVQNVVVTTPTENIVMGATELPRLTSLTINVVGG